MRSWGEAVRWKQDLALLCKPAAQLTIGQRVIVTQKEGKLMSVKPRTNFILDALILVAFLVVLVTGLAMSLGFVDGGGSGLRRGQNRTLEVNSESESAALLGSSRHTLSALHEWASYLMTALIVVHVIVHWKWVTYQVRQVLGRTPRRQPREKVCAEV